MSQNWGRVASTSGLDLLFVRQAVRRIESSKAADYREVAGWAVEDYLAEEKYKEKWLVAVRAWLDEVDVRKTAHPARYRGDFEQRIEDLARVCLPLEMRLVHAMAMVPPLQKKLPLLSPYQTELPLTGSPSSTLAMYVRFVPAGTTW